MHSQNRSKWLMTNALKTSERVSLLVDEDTSSARLVFMVECLVVAVPIWFDCAITSVSE